MSRLSPSRKTSASRGSRNAIGNSLRTCRPSITITAHLIRRKRVASLCQRAKSGRSRCPRRTKRRQDRPIKLSTWAQSREKWTRLMSSKMVALGRTRTARESFRPRDSRRPIWATLHRGQLFITDRKLPRSRSHSLW